MAAFFLCTLPIAAAAQPGSSAAPVVWERYLVPSRKVSVMLPKMPTVIKTADTCGDLVKESYFAYAEQAVYELTIASKSSGVPRYCTNPKKFGENTLAERLAAIRSARPESTETTNYESGRQIYRFSNAILTQWIIPDMKRSRWIELSINQREDAAVDEQRFLGSLDLSASDGKAIGEGSPVTLGDADFKTEPDSGPTRQSETVRIIAKPRAYYTDDARRGSVQGSVRLKVELLANGGVGNIEVVRELPNGLTEQAIAAAKKIVFLPQRVNGVPVAKIVIIEYGFSIY